jgi:hypothetical protein
VTYKMITASLALLFVLAVAPAYGEEEGDVYYCADIDGNGFHYDKESGSYKRSGFNSNKFKMKFNPTNNSIKISHGAFGEQPKDMHCAVPDPSKPMVVSCLDFFYMFNFNATNGRYLLSLGYGYVASSSDTVIVYIGKCDKF